MIDKNKIKLFKEIFSRAESILIICPENISRDQLLAATALYGALGFGGALGWEGAQKVSSSLLAPGGAQKGGSSSLEATSQSKTASVATSAIKLLCEKKFTKQEKQIAFVDEIKNEIGHENLCISLDYLENSIDKVSYHVSEETNKFYLTVKPKKGFEPLSNKNVEFSYTGADADMIILFGVNELEELGKLYVGYEGLFANAAVVSFNSYETDFGNLKFDVSVVSGFSEFVAQLLLTAKFGLNQDAATNLLVGINKTTKNLNSFSATADTFEVVSKLLRAGARRSFAKKKV